MSYTRVLRGENKKEIQAYNKKLEERFLKALAAKVEVKHKGESLIRRRYSYVGDVAIETSGIFSSPYGFKFGLNIKVDGFFPYNIKAVNYKLQPPQNYHDPDEVTNKEIEAVVKKVLARVKVVQEAHDEHNEEKARDAYLKVAKAEASKGFQKEFNKMGFSVEVKADANKVLEEVTFEGDDARKLLALLKLNKGLS